MALEDATLELIGDYIATIITHASLHNADPGTAGTTGVVSGTSRVAISWSVDADGDLTFSATSEFTGAGSEVAVSHVALWPASSGGTLRGRYALSGDTTTATDGTYNLTGITLAGSST